ncbi:PD-(D/E)XK motif protein [Polynucleobacter sp. JS-Safj-400b-B2]|uniref:PD-(D/E)XK motif protein n=1 Tax=Polynucleobacter sp. JS-Safj-400b-B2 TaxID=2576921 RepID=UPI001C0C5724|nr:PD-(D/E)XK motif protein [Polynucleobacter sp. JS-Safj-400b-B2]MBU3625497.1 PD-(D/E)XK motif protein [Polynucleobacter sp. JS-Safj-400b-B2]
MDGSPVFLLFDSSESHYTPGYQFKHLTAQFHVTCNVSTQDANLQGQFALVACESSVPELHEIFIRCFGAAIEELPVACGTRELSSCIRDLLDLFRALSQPGSREISGLWAELYVIAKSGDILSALACWREDSYDRFDFSWNDGRLEVKSSVQSTRLHEFSLEQLATPFNGVGYVASLLLQPLTGGTGILEFAATIETAVQHSPALKKKLWKNMAKALGSDFSEGLDRQFDVSYADRHLTIYSMGDIPRPDTPADPRIKSIKFAVDLTTVEPCPKGASNLELKNIFPSSNLDPRKPSV